MTPEEIRQLAIETERLKRANAENVDEQRSIRDTIIDQTKQLQFQQTLKRDILKTTNDIYKLQYDISVSYDRELGTRQAQLSIDKDIEKATKAQRSLEQDINLLRKDGSKLSQDLADSLTAQMKEGKKVLATLKDQQDTTKQIRSNMGVAGFQGLSEIFSKMGGKASQLAKPFEAMAEASREAVEGGVKENKKTEERKAILEEIASGKRKATKAELGDISIINKEGKKLYGKAAENFLKKGNNITKIAGKQVGKGQLAMKGLQAGFKMLGPLVKRALGPIGLILTLVDIVKGIVKAMAAASEATAAFSRNMLISREAARELFTKTLPAAVGYYNDIQASQGEITISVQKMQDAMATLNDQLGIQDNLVSDIYSNTTLNVGEVAKMTNYYGLSAEASTRLFLEAEKTGASLEDQNRDLFGNIAALQVSTGYHADMNKIIEETTKISGNLYANFRGNTKEMAKAVFQSKLLGLSLSETENIGKSLLNFEQSIAAEMEAEMLLGKDINLEKAREYAVLGQTDKLMREINKQAGSYTDFLNMNMFQRESLAKALGMEVSQLADMFRKQEEADALRERNQRTLNQLKEAGIDADLEALGIKLDGLTEIQLAGERAGKTQEDINRELGDFVAKKKNELGAQQRFTEALDKAKEAFARMVDGGLLDSLADVLDGLVNSALFAGYKEEGEARRIATAAKEKGNEEEVKIANAAVEAQKDNKSVDKIKNTAGTAMAAAATGAAIGSVIPGVGTAIGAAIGGIGGLIVGYLENEQTEAIANETLEAARNLNLVENPTPSSTDTANDFIMRPGQRPLKFNKGDLIIGGTNLGGEGNDEVVSLLKELIETVQTTSGVYMDSTQVGTALTVGSYKLQ